MNGRFIEGMDEKAYQPFDSLPAARCQNQDRVRVVGALVVLSMLLVCGGYPIIAR